jgi:hypothetical protein
MIMKGFCGRKTLRDHETGLRRRWLEYDAARDWLPAHDQAELQRLEHLTAHRQA